MSYEYKGYNERNNKHVLKYKATHYKQVTVSFDREYFDSYVKPLCDSMGVSVASFIKNAVEHEVESLTKK